MSDPFLPPRSGWRREWPIVLVLAASLASLVVVATGHFRPGTVAFAAALLLALLLRISLGDRRSGLLAVRSRLLDGLTLAALAALTLALALVIPPPT